MLKLACCSITYHTFVRCSAVQSGYISACTWYGLESTVTKSHNRYMQDGSFCDQLQDWPLVLHSFSSSVSVELNVVLAQVLNIEMLAGVVRGIQVAVCSDV